MKSTTSQLFAVTFVTLGLFLILFDTHATSRAIAIPCLAAAVVWMLWRAKGTVEKQTLRREHDVLSGLPSVPISDADVYGLDRTPALYTRLRRNPRVMSILHRMRPLRRYNDTGFATALAYIDHYLKKCARQRRYNCRVDMDHLVALKERALLAMHDYAMLVPEQQLYNIGFTGLLHALDVVLHAEGVSRFGRVQDIYPIGVSRAPSTPGSHSLWGQAVA